MKTYKNFLTESKNNDIKTKFHYIFNEIDSFLRREKIVGFTENIISIIVQRPTDDVLSDIKESFYDIDGIKIDDEDINSMEIKDMLEKYLSWHGIESYTEPIISIALKSTTNRKDREILIWTNKYYYRPEKGARSVWTWNNPKMSGIPELIGVEKIYGTPDYKGKDYYKTEKIYKK